MPSMLGAQLEDLTSLAAQLNRTGGSITECQSSSTGTTNNVVSTVRQAADAALSAITNQMDGLRAAVAAANAASGSAEWTGANSERFRSAYADFDSSMVRAETSTKDTFQQFQRAIGEMSQSLDSYAQELAKALTSARNSTDSMARAVEAQRANLDAVMNTGLTVG